MNSSNRGFPNSGDFASAFGQAVWLMTVSKAHRTLQVRDIEDLVSPAILLQQFKLYYKDKQPIAFLSWASVSDSVKEKMRDKSFRLSPADWRSGSNIAVVECVSPFASADDILEQFFQGIQERKVPDKA